MATILISMYYFRVYDVILDEVSNVEQIIKEVFLSGRTVCHGLVGLENQIDGNSHKLPSNVKHVEFPWQRSFQKAV